MKIELTIPDDLAKALPGDPEGLSRAVVEAIALEAYRAKQLSGYQLRRILGLESRFALHAFLKERRVPLNYYLEDLQQDIETMRGFEMPDTGNNTNAA
jgi:predicted HTH domain antitoxin